MLEELGIREAWAHVLHGIRHGFDVGVRDPVSKTHKFENHSSSSLVSMTILVAPPAPADRTQDPDFIDSYIAEEQAAGRYSEGFDPSDLESIIGCFRTAPLGLVPKPNSTKMRLVQDLSYPRNDVGSPALVYL